MVLNNVYPTKDNEGKKNGDNTDGTGAGSTTE
jgi:hypothetical protein